MRAVEREAGRARVIEAGAQREPAGLIVAALAGISELAPVTIEVAARAGGRRADVAPLRVAARARRGRVASLERKGEAGVLRHVDRRRAPGDGGVAIAAAPPR